MKTAFSIVFLLVCFICPASAYNNQPETYQSQGIYRWHWPTYHQRHYFRHIRHARRSSRKGKRYRHVGHYRHYARHSVTLAGQPPELMRKVQEIVNACGSHVISSLRVGARVAGTNRISNHALNMADDVQGNPHCIYMHLRGWPGGYSVDYARVNHVHISYNRHKEWGARFVHGGGYRHYAHRRRHYALAR